MPKRQTCGGDHLPTYPNQDGCWFCNCSMSPMEFDTEFDTWYHPECLEKAVAEGNEEAIIMERARC